MADPQTPPSKQPKNTLEIAQLVAGGCVVLVDKASGFTSHDAVARVRRVFGTRKVGHAGTLDPLATGLLTLGIGPATRLLTHLVGLDKTYTATIRLGLATTTDDSEGEVTASAKAGLVEQLAADPQRIYAAVKELTGEILQVPTQVSAIKIAGKKAYELVRQGQQVEIAPRAVTVHSFELGVPRLERVTVPLKQSAEAAAVDAAAAAGVNRGELARAAAGGIAGVGSAAADETGASCAVLDIDCVVHVSSGTYVRALARDLGKALGVYGHLTALRRESVGPFSVAEAVPLQVLTKQADAVRAGGEADFSNIQVLQPAAVAGRVLQTIVVDAATATALGHGKQPHTAAADTKLAAAVTADARLVALVSVKAQKMRVVTGFAQPG